MKSKQLNYKVIKYEYNKKKHFQGNSAVQNYLPQYEQDEHNEIIEKFESLRLLGFESIKYLEEQQMVKDSDVDQDAVDQIRLMSYEIWEKELSERDRRKIHKRKQDQIKVLRRILETDLGLYTESELYDEIKYRKSRKTMPKYLPALKFGRSVSAPDMGMVYSSGTPNESTQPPNPFDYPKGDIATPPMRRFGNSYGPEGGQASFKPSNSEYEAGEAYPKDSGFDTYKPYSFSRYNPTNQYLNE